MSFLNVAKTPQDCLTWQDLVAMIILDYSDHCLWPMLQLKECFIFQAMTDSRALSFNWDCFTPAVLRITGSLEWDRKLQELPEGPSGCMFQWLSHNEPIKPLLPGIYQGIYEERVHFKENCALFCENIKGLTRSIAQCDDDYYHNTN